MSVRGTSYSERTMKADPFELDRFVSAQAGTHEMALAEIRAGRKRTHWMWFVFPQLTGLGHSPMTQRYGVTGLDEAEAYLTHPTLGPRLREVTSALGDLPHPDAEKVFGLVDAMKLRSSLTLFATADKDGALFQRMLARWFGAPDPATLRLLGLPL